MVSSIPVLLLLVNLGIGILGLTISLLLLRTNRKKGTTGLILSVIFLLIIGYYWYVVFFTLPGEPEKAIQMPAPESVPAPPQPEGAQLQENHDFVVVVETDGEKWFVEQNDYLTIKKDVTVKILGAQKSGEMLPGVKINVVGFTPKNEKGSPNDIGHSFTYKDMRKKFSIDKEESVYKVEVKQNEKTLGFIFLKFI